MPEPIARAAVDQIIQIGVEAEATPGTQVAATKRLPGISMDIKPIVDTQGFRAYGYNIETVRQIMKLWANGTWTGPVDFNQVIYPLSGLIGLPGTGPVAIGATAGRTWDFNPVSQGADPHSKTFTVEQGDAIAATIATQLKFQSFGMQWAQDSLTMSGNLFCRSPLDNQTLTATGTSNEIWQLVIDATSGSYTLTYGGNTTAAIDFDATPAELLNALTDLVNVNVGDFQVTGGPGNSGGTTPYLIEGIGALAGTNLTQPTIDDTLLVGGGAVGTISTTQAGGVAGTVSQVPQRPASRTQMDMFIDNTFAGIGTTKIVPPYAGSFEIADKFIPFWAFNTDYSSFADTVRTPAEVKASFSTSNDAAARALYSSISSNPVKYIRYLIQGENIGASADEMIRVDIAVRIESIDTDQDANGVYGRKFNWAANHDSDMNGAYRVRVVNRLTAL